MSRFSRGGFSSHLAAFVAGAVAAATWVTVAPARGEVDPARFGKLDVFAQALSYVENHYVEDVDEQELVYGAVDGMIQRLDAHSRFLPPERYRRLREETEGAYGGIGVVLQAGAAPVIIEVLAGSPADRAGIAVGDRLVSVDGAPASDWHGELRGTAGSRIVLELAREGWNAPRSFTLVRERVRISAVETAALGSGVLYLRLRQFQHATAAEVRRALMRARDGDGLRGLVVDLRGNPGGLFDEAVRVADLFLSEGIIVTVTGRFGRTLEEHRAHPARSFGQLPLAVLIDGGSASSAEIVAGALHDHGRAVLVGESTYGKGSVQSFLDLADGSGLKLTTARYVTPSGRSIQGVGIDPDVPVSAAPNRPPLQQDPQVVRAYRLVLAHVESLGPKPSSSPVSLTAGIGEP